MLIGWILSKTAALKYDTSHTTTTFRIVCGDNPQFIHALCARRALGNLRGLALLSFRRVNRLGGSPVCFRPAQREVGNGGIRGARDSAGREGVCWGLQEQAWGGGHGEDAAAGWRRRDGDDGRRGAAPSASVERGSRVAPR